MLIMKRNDTRTAIKATLIKPSGSAADLTGATVKFVMAKYGKIIANRAADMIDAPTGKVCFVFLPEETNVLGSLKAEFEVTYPDGSIETFPNDGYIEINFIADLA